LEVWTNGVRAINNINNNNAYGSYSKRASYENYTQRATDYQNMYNREPDLYITSNVQLTDDRYILLFEMRNTGVLNGYYPSMMMDYTNKDDVVFAYLDENGGKEGVASIGANNKAGEYRPSQAMPQRAVFSGTDYKNDTTNTAQLRDKEFLVKASVWDQMAMARDDGNRYYHLSLYNRDACALTFVYDRFGELYTDNTGGWGAGIAYSDYGSQHHAYKVNNNALAFERVDYNGYQLGRYQYPKMIVKGNSKTDKAIIYLSYFDAKTRELIFRNFQIGRSGKIDTYTDDYGNINKEWQLHASDKNNTNDKANDNSSRYSQYTNFRENIYCGSDTGDDIHINGKLWNVGRLPVTTTASNEFAMGVTSDNYVIMLWYNANTGKLQMAKSKRVVDGANAIKGITWTEQNINFPLYVGHYVSMEIDSSNNIHIAAFDENAADLTYMYLAKGSTTLKYVTVDQAFNVGKWTQVKVKNNVPYIAYYNSSETNSHDGIKLAYLKNPITSSSDVKPGVDEKTGYTTGDWEYMTVPSITNTQGGKDEFKNVCLDFDSKGVPVVGYLGEKLEFGKWCDE
ncbi:MAG: hypothetical protein K2M99_00310, partial [Treponemataceae bacterium]|nr:hypothetical protein [Treponemataceae bacterium]